MDFTSHPVSSFEFTVRGRWKFSSKHALFHIKLLINNRSISINFLFRAFFLGCRVHNTIFTVAINAAA